jgi:hypothetical protein
MNDKEKQRAENISQQRQNVRAEREQTSQKREKIQEHRARLYSERAELADKESDDELDVDFHRMQDEIQLLQHEILKLQTSSHADQDETNRLRRLADGYSNEILSMAEDKQTRAENMQTMQENLQRLREDVQRKQEEDTARLKEKHANQGG